MDLLAVDAPSYSYHMAAKSTIYGDGYFQNFMITAKLVGKLLDLSKPRWEKIGWQDIEAISHGCPILDYEKLTNWFFLYA